VLHDDLAGKLSENPLYHIGLFSSWLLDDVSVPDIEEALGRPVALAATMRELLGVLTDRGKSV